jgi:hypothetical protein
MQRALVCIMLIWFVIGCTYKVDEHGCFGYTYDPGLKRGTVLKNRNYISPYRQCVEKESPHRNTERK